MSKSAAQVPIYNIKTKEMHAMNFNIIDLQNKDGLAYDSSEAHRHTFFELFLFNGGGGKHEIDFNLHAIEANSAHFVSPGQIHHVFLKNTRGFVICFTEDFVSLKARENFSESFPFYDISNPQTLSLDKKLAAEIGTLVSLIQLEFAKHRDQDVLRSYLNVVLLKLKTAFLSRFKTKAATKPTKKRQVLEFKKLINEHYLELKNASAYAQMLNISANHLNALCKTQVGKTASAMIQERVLLETKRLLYGTDMNIKEISYYLNFEDVPYFNRFFKKHSKMTPLEYRKRASKNR